MLPFIARPGNAGLQASGAANFSESVILSEAKNLLWLRAAQLLPLAYTCHAICFVFDVDFAEVQENTFFASLRMTEQKCSRA